MKVNTVTIIAIAAGLVHSVPIVTGSSYPDAPSIDARDDATWDDDDIFYDDTGVDYPDTLAVENPVDEEDIRR